MRGRRRGFGAFLPVAGKLLSARFARRESFAKSSRRNLGLPPRPLRILRAHRVKNARATSAAKLESLVITKRGAFQFDKFSLQPQIF
jgi:hypothetical protein